MYIINVYRMFLRLLYVLYSTLQGGYRMLPFSVSSLFYLFLFFRKEILIIMSISTKTEQETILAFLKNEEVFNRYFKPLVGLPQSDNHHGMDAMQHTIAVFRSIENVINELYNKFIVKISNRSIMSLYLAALFHDTGKAVCKVEIRPNEFDYKDHALESIKLLDDFEKLIRDETDADFRRHFRLAKWLVIEHTNFHMAIKQNKLREWLVGCIRKPHFDAISTYKHMVKDMIVLSAADAASKYAVCEGDAYHDAVVRYSKERYEALRAIEKMAIPVTKYDLELQGEDKAETDYILNLCWDGTIKNEFSQIKEALTSYRAKKRYTISLEY